MAAIGLAAALLEARHGDVVLGSFAADHVIEGADAFAETVRQGVEAARAGYLVTVGIAATEPSTAFGYVRSGEPLGLEAAPDVRHAAGFTEKPDEETATAYLATGEYRWNAGMFIVRARVLLDHLAAQLPALHDGLREIAAAWDGPEREPVLARVWPGLTKIAIDHAIAEPVAAAGGDALVLRIDADGTLVVPGAGRTVTVIGVPGAVVVDTPDAVLVTTREHAQQVKAAVDGWRARGRDDLL